MLKMKKLNEIPDFEYAKQLAIAAGGLGGVIEKQDFILIKLKNKKDLIKKPLYCKKINNRWFAYINYKGEKHEVSEDLPLKVDYGSLMKYVYGL